MSVRKFYGFYLECSFNIDRITTQHIPKYVENCFDTKVSHNCLSNFCQIFCNLGYNSENSVFSQLWINYFVMNPCLPCSQTVTL